MKELCDVCGEPWKDVGIGAAAEVKGQPQEDYVICVPCNRDRLVRVDGSQPMFPQTYIAYRMRAQRDLAKERAAQVDAIATNGVHDLIAERDLWRTRANNARVEATNSLANGLAKDIETLKLERDEWKQKTEQAERALAGQHNAQESWCAYCGATKPDATLEELKAHVLECPKHPLMALRKAMESAKQILDNQPGITFEMMSALNVRAWNVLRLALLALEGK